MVRQNQKCSTPQAIQLASPKGEIIFAERPLLAAAYKIMPLSQGATLDRRGAQEIKPSDFESLLEAAIARLPPESQADYRALQNPYTGDMCGPLLGILRTNNYAAINLFDGSDRFTRYYDIVGKIASRINHSCIPNVKFYFKPSSFSMQFYALRDIKAGDQLFYSYCLVNRNLAQRQADLVPYGFVCKCSGCVNATPATDELRTTTELKIAFFEEAILNRSKFDGIVLESALRLEKDMVKEGLVAHCTYLAILMLISAAYVKLGKVEESRKYGTLLEKLQKFKQDEWRGVQIP